VSHTFCEDTSQGLAQVGDRRRQRASRSYTPADPLLTAREAAAETGRALSTFYRDLRAGLLPQPCLRVGRSPRWRRSVLRASLGLAD